MIDLIAKGIASLFGLLDKAIPDQKLKAEIQEKLIEMQSQLYTAQASIITAEANGQSWMQRNWRPCLMFIFMALIVNNYLLAPFVHIFYSEYPVLPLPDKLWSLLEIGVGGYIVGRSGEKIAGNFKKNN